VDNCKIYGDEYISIFSSDGDIYMESYKKGFAVEKLDEILFENPRVRITNMGALKTILASAPRAAEKIGRMKDRIELYIADNGLKAELVLNLSPEELDAKNRDGLIREIAAKLNENGVCHGIKKEVLGEELKCGKRFVIAEGTPPLDGKDSVVKMYEMQEAKPLVKENGTVDFYDLKLINRVKSGDWLGERIDATEGTPGQTVKGEMIKAANGKNYPLLYDRNTVKEVVQDNRTVLYSRISGAVNYTDGRLRVLNHLEIAGDVNFSTGNVNFDGYVSIKGTVADGFSVIASRDIEINGDLGIGNVKEIISTGGSVYIKGGIVSKGQVKVKASGNVYSKFLENVTVECSGAVHIGFYSINSNISAKAVTMDSVNGRIIGGNTRAEIMVLAPIIGSESEKRTYVEVLGFDREALKADLDAVFRRISELKNEQQKLKCIISALEGKEGIDAFNRKEYNDAADRMAALKQEIRDLEDKRKNIAEYLKARGEGEIRITKTVYTNSFLVIKKTPVDLPAKSAAVTYFFQDGGIKQL